MRGMKTNPHALPLIAVCAAAFSFASAGWAQPPHEEHAEEPELASAMAQLQYFTHKLALSVEARNAELAGFYLHEAEETAESIRDGIPEYEGMSIGPLVGSMLIPLIERVEESLDEPDWPQVDRALSETVQSCNSCHEATEHGFIVIELRPGLNPYMQSFRPGDES